MAIADPTAWARGLGRPTQGLSQNVLSAIAMRRKEQTDAQEQARKQQIADTALQQEKRMGEKAALDTQKTEAEMQDAALEESLKKASLPILMAFTADTPEDRRDYLKIAQEQTGLPENHPVAIELNKLANSPDIGGEAVTKDLGAVVEWQKRQGHLGELQGEGTGTSGKSPDIIERETKAKEMQAEAAIENTRLRKLELDEKVAQFDEKRGDTPAYIQKVFDATDTAARENEVMVNQTSSLAREFENIAEDEQYGGMKRSASEWLKERLGKEDDISLLYTKARMLRGKQAMANLPPGAASDADVAIAMEGVPTKDASPKHMAKWLRGVSKLAELNNVYYVEKAKYLSESPRRGTRGFQEYWEEKRDELTEGIYTPEAAQNERKVVKRGTYNGKPVIQYSDGTIDYAD